MDTVVPGFNLLFDPWAVEGLGLHRRGTLDFRVSMRGIICRLLRVRSGCGWRRQRLAGLWGLCIWILRVPMWTGACLRRAGARSTSHDLEFRILDLEFRIYGKDKVQEYNDGVRRGGFACGRDVG